MMETKTGREKWEWLLRLCLTASVVWFALKYLLPLFLPLVFAFFMVRIVCPSAVTFKKWAHRLHLPLSSKVCRLTVFFAYFLLAAGLCTLVLCKLFSQAKKLLERIGVYRLWAEAFLMQCCVKCDGFFGLSQGESFQKLQAFAQSGGGEFWTSRISNVSLNFMSCLKMFGSFGLLILFSILLTIMALSHLERWYQTYRHFSFYRECHEILHELTGAGYAYVRTQVVVITLIAMVCAVGLFLMKNPYPLLLGIFIAVIDAFPVLGSGTVFFPWIVLAMIFGKVWKVIGLLFLYALCQMVRQCLEPRLMGKRLHIEPAMILISIFAGIQLFSAAGVLLGPVGFLLIRSMMRLWKDCENKKNVL